MTIRSVFLLLVLCLPFFGAPDNNKTAEVQKTIQGLKATVAQLHDQIFALEAQLGAAENANLTRHQSAHDSNPDSSRAALAASGSTTSVGTSQQVVKSNGATRQQCTATTKRGTRCLRLASPGKSTCWQHGS